MMYFPRQAGNVSFCADFGGGRVFKEDIK